MCERPIKLLVDALKTLGAGIGYLQKEGYQPIEIEVFDKSRVKYNHIKIMDQLGVKSTFTSNGILLEKKPAAESIVQDFTDCPDLAQTIAVVCAAKGIECTMTGLESLRIKETDRIAALQNELRKFGSD